jgi:protein-S-isoprenylcysteine O-methyltransferase Ste14
MQLPVAVQLAWLAFVVVWGLTALRVRRTARREPIASRLVMWIMMGGVFVLLFRDTLRIGPLAWRVIPAGPGAATAGSALTVLGVGFAIWARLTLGQNWSGIVTIKEGHQLIRRGPYALVRHPIYAGMQLAMVGTAVAIGEVRGLVAAVIAFAAWIYKSRLEERWLTEHFGERYEEYRREVKALIPYVF